MNMPLDYRRVGLLGVGMCGLPKTWLELGLDSLVQVPADFALDFSDG